METSRIIRAANRTLGTTLALAFLGSLAISPAFAGDRLEVHREALQREAQALEGRNLRSVDAAPATKLNAPAEAVLVASTITLDSGEVEPSGLEADEDCE